MVEEQTEFDVVIAGGGVVGATLACALGFDGVSVALVESQPLREQPLGPSPQLRVSALSPASQRVLAALGAWRGIADRRLCPYTDMRVWDSGGPGQIHFSASMLGVPALGWIVENRVIQDALFDRMEDLSSVRLFAPARVQDFRTGPDCAEVILDDNTTLRTRLLAGADGARSQVRELAGIPVTGWNYGQRGVVATIDTEFPHAHTAWQRFLADGPLAFLPLFDGQCSIVWSTRIDHAERLVEMPTPAFEDELAEAFQHRLGAVRCTSTRVAFPLRLQFAPSYGSDRVTLLGDAAHTVHPLAGQGANLGILDAAALAEVIGDARTAARDPGSSRVLRRYERRRKGHNLLTMAAMDAFHRGFGGSNPVHGAIRGIALNLTDGNERVKEWLSRYAMGLRGNLPRLARTGPAGRQLPRNF